MKNLIYYTVGHSPYYIRMLGLQIRSLEWFSLGSIDYMVITDNTTKNLIESYKPGVFDYFITSTDSAFQSSANKLKIYQYEKLSEYDNVLYCDTDALWNKSPDEVFRMIKKDKIHIVNELQLMNHPSGYWGNYLLTEKEREDLTHRNIMGINGGILGFKSSSAELLKGLDKFVWEDPSLHNALYEQPFLNVYLYRNNLIDTSLNEFVCNSYDGINLGNKHFIHFLGGDDQSKLAKMLGYDQMA